MFAKVQSSDVRMIDTQIWEISFQRSYGIIVNLNATDDTSASVLRSKIKAASPRKQSNAINH
jgi:hypothetical protein